MKSTPIVWLCVVASCVFMTIPARGDSILAPGDPILAIDVDALQSNSSYPSGEAPRFVLDDMSGTKYLNFGKRNTGFIVTPAAGASQVLSFVLTTAGDAPARDPASWELYGTNDPIMSLDNSPGDGEAWTFIDAGTVMLPDTRQTDGPLVTVNNPSSYSSYRFAFPTVKNDCAANSMQVADVAFYQTSDGSGPSVLAVGDPILAIQRPAPTSNYPCGESPANLLDDNAGSKYLNFGEENTGFIVTPAAADVVRSFQITTANDAPERDPATWELYGTNDAIVSADNSQGLGENWTLIGSGSVDLPMTRQADGPLVEVPNNTAYSSFRMVFPTLRDAATANSMQIAGIQFFNVVPEPMAGSLIVIGLILTFLARRRQ